MILDNNSYISVYLMPDCLFYFFYLRYLCDFSFCDKCDTDTGWKIIANLAKCSLAKKWLCWEDYPGSILYSQLAMREDKQGASIFKYWSIEVMDVILVIHMMYVPTPLTTQASIAVAGSGWPWLRLRSITCHLWPAPAPCPLLPIILRSCTIEDLRWRDVIISFLHSPNDTFHQPPILSLSLCLYWGMPWCWAAGVVSIYLQYWYHTANVTW